MARGSGVFLATHSLFPHFPRSSSSHLVAGYLSLRLLPFNTNTAFNRQFTTPTYFKICFFGLLLSVQVACALLFNSIFFGSLYSIVHPFLGPQQKQTNWALLSSVYTHFDNVSFSLALLCAHVPPYPALFCCYTRFFAVHLWFFIWESSHQNTFRLMCDYSPVLN